MHSTLPQVDNYTSHTHHAHSRTHTHSPPLQELGEDILVGLREMVEWLMQREYIEANNAYLRVAISNAPWPIGVTNVGIHSRTGREKIFAQKIAHVLNDEKQRKYLQALKRLMTFCQKRYPNIPSRCLEFRGLQQGLYPLSPPLDLEEVKAEKRLWQKAKRAVKAAEAEAAAQEAEAAVDAAPSSKN
eukprot:m.101323 g.101323  ORF g.101323 m.101323 type:complete len:187 (+) comp13197_c0_seq1:240-800(+)